MNVIKNLLYAVNSDAELHFGLLANDVVFIKLQFAGLDTLQKFFLRKSLQIIFTYVS